MVFRQATSSTFFFGKRNKQIQKKRRKKKEFTTSKQKLIGDIKKTKGKKLFSSSRFLIMFLQTKSSISSRCPRGSSSPTLLMNSHAPC